MKMRLLFLISLMAFGFTSPAFAEVKNLTTPTVTPFPKTVEYELPYPGILPDSPLYPLKMIRDKIVKSFITDPQREAEFLLLNSDKRFYAGIFLVQKNKDELALTTISKGNNYFDETIGKVHDAQKQKKDMNPFIDKMSLSIKKHKIVLKDLLSQTDSQFEKGFEKEYDRTLDMEKTVGILKPKKTEKVKTTSEK